MNQPAQKGFISEEGKTEAAWDVRYFIRNLSFVCPKITCVLFQQNEFTDSQIHMLVCVLILLVNLSLPVINAFITWNHTLGKLAICSFFLYLMLWMAIFISILSKNSNNSLKMCVCGGGGLNLKNQKSFCWRGIILKLLLGYCMYPIVKLQSPVCVCILHILASFSIFCSKRSLNVK